MRACAAFVWGTTGDHQLAAQLVKRSVALDDMIFLPEGISVIYEQLQ